MVKQVQDIERSRVIHFADDFEGVTTDTRMLTVSVKDTTCWVSYYDIGEFLHEKKPLYSMLTMVGMVGGKRVVIALWNPTGAYGLHLDLPTKEQVDQILRGVVRGDLGYGVTAVFGHVNPNVTFQINPIAPMVRDQYYVMARVLGISDYEINNTVMYIGEPLDALGATFH